MSIDTKGGRRRKTSILGQFSAIPRAMLECPARRALSLAARRALDRIEIELMQHGGSDNGRLPVTHRQFEDWGVCRHTVASAIRELQALGFIEVTFRGYGGSAEMRAPSLYRLTFRPAWNANRQDGDGTHEYLKIETVEQAEAIAKAARKDADARNVERGKKKRHPTKRTKFAPQNLG